MKEENTKKDMRKSIWVAAQVAIVAICLQTLCLGALALISNYI